MSRPSSAAPSDSARREIARLDKLGDFFNEASNSIKKFAKAAAQWLRGGCECPLTVTSFAIIRTRIELFAALELNPKLWCPSRKTGYSPSSICGCLKIAGDSMILKNAAIATVVTSICVVAGQNYGRAATPTEPRSVGLFRLPSANKLAAGLQNPFLLHGYDSFTGEVKKDVCVNNPSGVVLSDPSVGHADVQFQSTQGTNREVLVKELDLDAAAQLDLGALQVGAGATFLQRNTTSALHSYFHIFTGVRFDKRFLVTTDAALNTTGTKAIQNDNFFQVCGDLVIVGDTPGGRFDAVYTFRSLTRESFEQVTAEMGVAASAINFGASAQYVQSITKISKNSFAEMQVDHRPYGEHR